MWWYTIINLLLYLIALIIYLRTYKRIDVYCYILSIYTAVSVCCAFYAHDKPNEYDDLSIFNFIYLFVVILIFIHPFKARNFNVTQIKFNNTFLIKILVALYLVSGIISVVYTLPRAILLANSGEWAQLRMDVYNDMEGIELYTNWFERLCKNIYSYVSPFGIVWTFLQFTRPKFSKILTFSMLIVWALSEYSSATLVASRGMILTFGIKLLTLYVFFRNAIPQERKKLIYIAAGIAAVFFLSYSLSVTESRFGDDANDSLYMYFGHSMLAFNDGIMNNMHSFAWGKYFFKWIYEMLGFDSTINFTQLGSTHGTAFMTFVGCFYVDFGPIGTLLLAFIFSIFLSAYTRKSTYSFSSIIIIVYFASWFVSGVFVFGRSQSLAWLMLFVLSFIIKKIEKAN